MENLHIDYITECYLSLNLKERKCLCNGCGSKLIFLKIFKIPFGWFTSACNWHDVGYWIGGNEEHRAIVDNYFLFLMKQECGLNPIKHFIATRAYNAVRVAGSLSFNSRTQPLTFEELRKHATCY
jgi:hypothetical protein